MYKALYYLKFKIADRKKMLNDCDIVIEDWSSTTQKDLLRQYVPSLTKVKVLYTYEYKYVKALTLFHSKKKHSYIKGTREKMGLGDSGRRNLFSPLSKNFSNRPPQNHRIILFGWYFALKIIYKKFCWRTFFC